jgi:small GTP-binding protein
MWGYRPQPVAHTRGALGDEDRKKTIKILSVGESGVGKTQLMEVAKGSKFNNASISTIGVSFSVKEMTAHNGEKIVLQVWDTAGQERYRALTAAYFRGGNGAFLCFDLTRRSTFDALPQWIQEVKTHISAAHALMIVGTKSDLCCEKDHGEEDGAHKSHREVTTAEAADLAAKCEASYIETSALSGSNVDTALQMMMKQVLISIDAAEDAQTTDYQSSMHLPIRHTFRLSPTPEFSTGNCC